jgi:hypothetical protein
MAKKRNLAQNKIWLPPIFTVEYFQTMLNLYFPFLGAGIWVTHIEKDFSCFKVEMKLTGLNRNFVHSHFGGSLYMMCDPFYMFILMQNLGEEFIVWDKAAKIDFIKPGMGTVKVEFKISQEEISTIKQEAITKGKLLKVFSAQILDENEVIVANVEKTLYIRKLK